MIVVMVVVVVAMFFDASRPFKQKCNNAELR